MPPLLEIDRLTKYFAGLAALKDICFEATEGRIYGLIGPNGAGKTTLFSIIAGSQQPTSGTVVFRGENITGRKAHRAVKAGIVRTHQIARPFRSMTVLENVEVGVHFGGRTGSEGARAQAQRILEWVGLEHAGKFSASALCVGDQRRLELARALAAKPSLLLCDEVCAGLTENETAEVLRLLLRIRELGTTILYVEHNLKAIMSISDQVMVINFGQKLAEGSPEEMQNDPRVIEAYIGKSTADENRG